MSATVRNQGDSSSAATTLRYYRSEPFGTQVGTDAVGALAASGTSDESIDLTAPSSPGTYYYWACVDSGDGRERYLQQLLGRGDRNGRRSASRSGRGLAFGLQQQPRLPARRSRSRATVRNQGSGPSATTTLRYYRSTDATITTGDTEVDTDAVSALAASATSDESIDLTAPSSPGTYYYGACVDDVTGESDTSNNCSSAVTIAVGVPPAPDLVVGSPSVSNSSPETGGSFTLSATVSNDGDGGSAATTLRYYRSTNSTISTGDTEVGTDAVGALAASATSDESIDLTAPSQEGTYYYGACVNAVTGESDTSNNCSDGVEVEVSGGGAGRDGECVVGATYASGESCDVYGTGSSANLTFTVLSDGSARLGFITAGNLISFTSTFNGVLYHFVASHQGGGIWEIDEYIP